MADMFDVQSKRGSIWHRWDPHIHTPGTALNDQYAGPDPWAAFLDAIEESSPPIRAIGITDYFGIERYQQVVEEKRRGRLPGVGLIFPNVELRLGIETAKASAVTISTCSSRRMMPTTSTGSSAFYWNSSFPT